MVVRNKGLSISKWDAAKIVNPKKLSYRTIDGFKGKILGWKTEDKGGHGIIVSEEGSSLKL